MKRTDRLLFREGEVMAGDTVTPEAIDEIADGSLNLSRGRTGKHATLVASIETPEGVRRFTREPVLHSHVSDRLRADHPKAFKGAACRGCGAHLHAATNEVLRTWFETEFGDFCTTCFVPGDVLETLEDAAGTGIE